MFRTEQTIYILVILCLLAALGLMANVDASQRARPSASSDAPGIAGAPGMPRGERSRLARDSNEDDTQVDPVLALLDARPIVAVVRLDLVELSPQRRAAAIRRATSGPDKAELQDFQIALLGAFDTALKRLDPLAEQNVGEVLILFCGPDSAGNEPEPVWVIQPRKDQFTSRQIRAMEALARERDMEDFPLPGTAARLWIPARRAPVLVPRDPDHGRTLRDELDRHRDSPAVLVIQPDNLLRRQFELPKDAPVPADLRQAVHWIQSGLAARRQVWSLSIQSEFRLSFDLTFDNPQQARHFVNLAQSLARRDPPPTVNSGTGDGSLAPSIRDWVSSLSRLEWRARGAGVGTSLPSADVDR
ncbi:MAG: hypothetical protein JJU36_17675 [Phycisphaeraceae bacterium]|nr:hypothetical protein [Phycisphaeraceae bacterium]